MELRKSGVMLFDISRLGSNEAVKTSQVKGEIRLSLWLAACGSKM